MGRPKKFTREDVLKSAIPVFWERGYADTGLHDLEVATGVNKSGLYAEFRSKEDLFLACLRYYVEHMGANAILSAQPLGWRNIERLGEKVLECPQGRKGCFGINSMREMAILPSEAHQILSESKKHLRDLLEKNIRMEKTTMEAGLLAGVASTFFAGLCVEQNLAGDSGMTAGKIDAFVRMLRAM